MYIVPQIELCANFIYSRRRRAGILGGDGGAPPAHKNRRRPRNGSKTMAIVRAKNFQDQNIKTMIVFKVYTNFAYFKAASSSEATPVASGPDYGFGTISGVNLVFSH